MEQKIFKEAERIQKKIVEREKFLEVLNAKYKSTLSVRMVQKNGWVGTAELRIDRESDVFKAIVNILTKELEELRKEFSQL